LSGIKQFGLAFMHYGSDNDEAFPNAAHGGECAASLTGRCRGFDRALPWLFPLVPPALPARTNGGRNRSAVAHGLQRAGNAGGMPTAARKKQEKTAPGAAGDRAS